MNCYPRVTNFFIDTKIVKYVYGALRTVQDNFKSGIIQSREFRRKSIKNALRVMIVQIKPDAVKFAIHHLKVFGNVHLEPTLKLIVGFNPPALEIHKPPRQFCTGRVEYSHYTSLDSSDFIHGQCDNFEDGFGLGKSE